MGKLINPFNDTGFKIIFGKAKDKDILISFLNDLLEGTPFYDRIVDIEYRNTEIVGEHFQDRGVVNDIHCYTLHGKHIIVEMQNRPHSNFTDRMLLYNCRAIVDQAVRGEWDFKLSPVYSVCFTNFLVEAGSTSLKIDRMLCDVDTGKPVGDKQRFIYIQLPVFTKDRPEDCENNFERWIYSLKNMENMREIPFATRDNAFRRLQEVANEAALSEEERAQYYADQKRYWIITNIERTRYNEGKEEGIAQGIAQGRIEGMAEGEKRGMAKIVNMLYSNGMPLHQIAASLGISEDEVSAMLTAGL